MQERGPSRVPALPQQRRITAAAATEMLRDNSIKGRPGKGKTKGMCREVGAAAGEGKWEGAGPCTSSLDMGTTEKKWQQTQWGLRGCDSIALGSVWDRKGRSS